MTLPDVSLGQAHVQAHNDERHSILAFSNVMDWSIEIDPVMPPSVQNNWSTFGPDGNAIRGASVYTVSQSSLIGWDVILGAGIWTISLLIIKTVYGAIITIKLDDVTVGLIDGYSPGTAYNQIASAQGIVVATSGKKRLTLSNPTKNPTSSFYYAFLQVVSLRRTA